MDMVSSLAMITTRRTLERLTIMVRSLKAETWRLALVEIQSLCGVDQIPTDHSGYNSI